MLRDNKGNIFEVYSNLFVQDLDPDSSWDIKDCKPVKLTPEILTNNLGFTATDLNGFTQYQLEDFILIRADLGIKLGIDMPFTFVIKSSIQEMLNITEVHHLQNLFLDLKRKQLKWKI